MLKDVAPFFEAAIRSLRKDGIALVNVCLDRKSDPMADKIAAGFRKERFGCSPPG